MKKYFIIILLICVITQSYSKNNSVKKDSIESNTQKNIIKLNYLAILKGSINLGYERELNNYLSLQIQGYIPLSSNKYAAEAGVTDFNGGDYYYHYGIMTELRIYPLNSSRKCNFLI